MSNSKNRGLPSLSENDVKKDPFELFDQWFHDTLRSAPDYWRVTNAITLATATKKGVPSARILLLQEYSAEGFIFYTNYLSRKGEELAENPTGVMLYYDPALNRQIQITGNISKTSTEISDNYFNRQPKRNKLAAWAFAQSKAITRGELNEAFRSNKDKFKRGKIPRPDFWGGYILKPTQFEFWQGRPSRMHDRLRYQLGDQGQWVTDRLAP